MTTTVTQLNFVCLSTLQLKQPYTHVSILPSVLNMYTARVTYLKHGLNIHRQTDAQVGHADRGYRDTVLTLTSTEGPRHRALEIGSRLAVVCV